MLSRLAAVMIEKGAGSCTAACLQPAVSQARHRALWDIFDAVVDSKALQEGQQTPANDLAAFLLSHLKDRACDLEHAGIGLVCSRSRQPTSQHGHLRMLWLCQDHD